MRGELSKQNALFQTLMDNLQVGIFMLKPLAGSPSWQIAGHKNSWEGAFYPRQTAIISPKYTRP